MAEPIKPIKKRDYSRLVSNMPEELRDRIINQEREQISAGFYGNPQSFQDIKDQAEYNYLIDSTVARDFPGGTVDEFNTAFESQVGEDKGFGYTHTPEGKGNFATAYSASHPDFYVKRADAVEKYGQDTINRIDELARKSGQRGLGVNNLLGVDDTYPDAFGARYMATRTPVGISVDKSGDSGYSGTHGFTVIYNPKTKRSELVNPRYTPNNIGIENITRFRTGTQENQKYLDELYDRLEAEGAFNPKPSTIDSPQLRSGLDYTDEYRSWLNFNKPKLALGLDTNPELDVAKGESGEGDEGDDTSGGVGSKKPNGSGIAGVASGAGDIFGSVASAIEDPQNGKTSIAGSTIQGAGKGAALGASVGGPWGAAIGGVVGGAAGAITSSLGNKRINKQMEEQRAKAQLARNMSQIQPMANTQSPIYEFGTAAASISQPVEVEKDELVLRKNALGKYRVVADFKGGNTHEQGGEDFVIQKGDIVFPGKKRGLIMDYIKNNNHQGIESERHKLPKELPDSNELAKGLDGDPAEHNRKYAWGTWRRAALNELYQKDPQGRSKVQKVWAEEKKIAEEAQKRIMAEAIKANGDPETWSEEFKEEVKVKYRAVDKQSQDNVDRKLNDIIPGYSNVKAKLEERLVKSEKPTDGRIPDIFGEVAGVKSEDKAKADKLRIQLARARRLGELTPQKEAELRAQIYGSDIENPIVKELQELHNPKGEPEVKLPFEDFSEDTSSEATTKVPEKQHTGNSKGHNKLGYSYKETPWDLEGFGDKPDAPTKKPPYSKLAYSYKEAPWDLEGYGDKPDITSPKGATQPETKPKTGTGKKATPKKVMGADGKPMTAMSGVHTRKTPDVDSRTLGTMATLSDKEREALQKKIDGSRIYKKRKEAEERAKNGAVDDQSSFWDKLGSAAAFAPAIGQMIKSLESGEKENRRYISPETQQYKDTSEGLRNEARLQERIDAENAARFSGGSAQVARAGKAMAGARKSGHLQNIAGQEVQKAMAIEAGNIATRNQARQTNLELDARYDELDARNAAMKGAYLSKGMENFYKVLNQKAMDTRMEKQQDMIMDYLDTNDFELDKNGRKIRLKKESAIAKPKN